jgi:hypothetical protein
VHPTAAFDGLVGRVALTSLTQCLLGRQVLAEELAGPVHALSLDTKAPSDLAKK